MDGCCSLISGLRLSSVVPAKATGEDKVHDLTAMDLVMKLHYIRGVYFFRSSEELLRISISDLKKPMFPWLEMYYVASGRIRRSSDGGERPFIKCNDSGVRIVEAECEKTVDEWLSMENSFCGLIYSQALGPDLGFSPLVFIQLTRFKCGGLAVGLSWAHVLGDFFSAATFIATWGQILNDHRLPETLHVPSHPSIRSSPSLHRAPSSVKQVDPIGDLWIVPSDCKMATHSFRITEEHLDRILTTVRRNQTSNFSSFEAISAIFWKSLAKIRNNSASDTISICSTKSPNRRGKTPSNAMVMSAVEGGGSVAGAEEGALARLIREEKADESGEIEALLENEAEEETNFVAYGARLTFVNLEEAVIYGLELKGQKPLYANYEVGGVGEDGVVLVLPGPPVDGGRTVTVIVPATELTELRDEMKKQWMIV